MNSTPDISDKFPELKFINIQFRNFGLSKFFFGEIVTAICPEDNSKIKKILNEPGNKRVLVVDVSNRDEKKQPIALINPVIKNLSEETSVYEEGCLSIPETFIEIERPKTCEVEYIDEKGEKKNLKCDGLLSTCVQHEINHLDGKLIIDHLSKLKKDFIIKKISKIKKNPDRIVV